MINLYRRLVSILLPRERARFYTLLAVAAFSALFEAISIASFLPLLSVLADPNLVFEVRMLSAFYNYLDQPSVLDFQIFLAVFVFAIVIFGIALKMGTLYAITRFGQMRSFTLSSRLLQSYLHQPYEFFLERHSAEIGRTVLFEIDQLVQRVIQPGLQLAASVFLVFFIVLVLFIADPYTALVVTFILSITYGGIYYSIRKFLRQLGRQRFLLNEERFRMAQEPIEGIKYVKLRGLEDSYVGRFRGPARTMARINALSQILQRLPRQILELVGFGGILIYIVVNLVKLDSNLEQILPTMGLIAFAGIRLLPALQSVFQMVALLKSGEAILEQVEQDLQKGGVFSIGSEDLEDPLRLTGTLELRDVTYSYPGSEFPAVSNLNIEVPMRAMVGLVGGTGAGKTTVVDLLLGLITPQSGCILINDGELNVASLRRWQRTLGYVPQSIFLTDDSLAANIAFGVPSSEIDLNRVVHVAKVAALHDFVSSNMPLGYMTSIGERGVRLSGGQRQRIGIARALYFDPDVLIFDEATSALDNLTERSVMEAINELGGKKTIIVIAHRLSTVRNCDNIYFLDNGSVAASGKFDDLSKKSKDFREMAKYI